MWVGFTEIDSWTRISNLTCNTAYQYGQLEVHCYVWQWNKLGGCFTHEYYVSISKCLQMYFHACFNHINSLLCTGPNMGYICIQQRCAGMRGHGTTTCNHGHQFAWTPCSVKLCRSESRYSHVLVSPSNTLIVSLVNNAASTRGMNWCVCSL